MSSNALQGNFEVKMVQVCANQLVRGAGAVLYLAQSAVPDSCTSTANAIPEQSFFDESSHNSFELHGTIRRLRALKQRPRDGTAGVNAAGMRRARQEC